MSAFGRKLPLSFGYGTFPRKLFLTENYLQLVFGKFCTRIYMYIPTSAGTTVKSVLLSSWLSCNFLEQASQFFRDEYGGRMYNLSGFMAGIYQSPGLLPKDAKKEEGLSIHAGATESSQIMYLQPGLVAESISSAEPATGKDFEELLEIAKKTSWAGYFGSPRWAGPELGKTIIEIRSRAYLKLALHILAGGDPNELPGYSKYNRPANINPGLSERTRQENAKRAHRQQQWIDRTGAKL